ncbi:recombinase family protein [Massilia niabensis]|uniref:Recombinase family protein n=1 Tax=Massilia niabensis TaxID=544910 RepID=A0ABW0LA94_9BURK
MSGKVPALHRTYFCVLLHKNCASGILVVSELDHLSRDAQGIDATIETLAARRIEVIVLQLSKLDLNSSASKLMLAMLAAMPRWSAICWSSAPSRLGPSEG